MKQITFAELKALVKHNVKFDVSNIKPITTINSILWIFENHPEFADKCGWSKLTGSTWSQLLQLKPQFADKCDFSKLDGMNWCHLLQEQPQFADKCDFNKFNGYNWNFLLEVQPQLAKYRK